MPALHRSTSCKPAHEAIARARAEGKRVFGEPLIQHLVLDETDYLNRSWDHAAQRVMSPPFRPKHHQDSLWTGLQAGSLQVVATDHCFTMEQKRIGLNDFRMIPNGTGGLEDRMPVLWTTGVNSGRLTPNEFVAVLGNGAHPQHLSPEGRHHAGADADIVIWDPKATKTISAKNQVSRIEYNVFEGFELTGLPAKVYLRGRLAAENGQVRAERAKAASSPVARRGFCRPAALEDEHRAQGRRALTELSPAIFFKASLMSCHQRGPSLSWNIEMSMQNLTINPQRLWDSLMDTAQIGGTAKGGIRRLTLTDLDREVRDWFRSQCEALGCTGRSTRSATCSRQAWEAATSPHRHRQPSRHPADRRQVRRSLGVLGGLGGHAHPSRPGYETNAPLMLVNWTNEEGSRFAPAMLGSGVYAGLRQGLRRPPGSPGATFAEAIESIGHGKPSGSVKFGAMFELHIEQGPILEAEQKVVGIVDRRAGDALV